MSEKMRARDFSFLLTEASGTRSREAIVMAAGSGIVQSGTVIAKRDADSKYVPAKAAGADGTQTAVGVLCQTVDTTEDAQAVALVRDAEVKEPLLKYDTSVDQPTEITAKKAELSAVGIIVR